MYILHISTLGIQGLDPQQGKVKQKDRVIGGCDLATSESEEEQDVSIQSRILKELKKASAYLDTVESQVAGAATEDATVSRAKWWGTAKDDIKLSTARKFKKSNGNSHESTSDDSDVPNINVLKSSNWVLKKVDQRLAQLDRPCSGQGTKLKCKKGVNIEVFVERKVAWPQDFILGGANQQCFTFDQLSLTEFVQRFTWSIKDELYESTTEHMLVYLSDLIEDNPILHGPVPRPPMRWSCPE